MFSRSIQKLIEQFSKFPTIGPRTAARFVFYLIHTPRQEVEELIESIQNLKNKMKICSFCFNSYEGEGNLCPICQNPQRDKTLLCIVEKEIDLAAIEKTKKYNGLYFVLGGTASFLKKEALEKSKTNDLIERLKNPSNFGISEANFQEIILALNPTAEGEATALYLERNLSPLNIKITRLARGLPTGAEMEYADKETLKSAFEGRK